MSSSSSPASSFHVDATSLKKVHDAMKKDIGAVHSLFANGPKTGMHTIKDLTDDAVTQYGFTTKEERVAALYLFCLAKVKGTEMADYNTLLAILRQPCPKAPSDNATFLPYLSFLCAPDRKKFIHDDRPIDSKQYDPADDGRIVPPHPRTVAEPAVSTRFASLELTDSLRKAAAAEGGGSDKLTFASFCAAMKEVDRGVTTAEAKRLFTEGFLFAKMSGKMEEKTAVPVAALLDVCKPQLTMEKQKSRSSSLMKGVFTWDATNPPPSPRSAGAVGNSPRKAPGGTNSPRNNNNGAGAGAGGSALSGSNGLFGGSSGATPRSSSSSSARKGFAPTRSAELRQQMAKEQLSDPTCPYYKGEYKHIPAVPEAHFKKQSKLGLTSQYAVSPRNSPRNSPRRPSADQQ